MSAQDNPLTGNSSEDSRPWLKPHRFQPGKSGNPSGRPKGLLTKKLDKLLKATNPKTGETYGEEFIKKFVARAGKDSDRLALEVFDRIDGPIDREPTSGSGNVSFHVHLSAPRPSRSSGAIEVSALPSGDDTAND